MKKLKPIIDKNIETDIDEIKLINGKLYCYKKIIKVEELVKVFNTKIKTIAEILNREEISPEASLSFDEISTICLHFDTLLGEKDTPNSINIYETIPFNTGGVDIHERPPIITIMGHVDHGKTTLLDKIRKSNLVDSEHGKITQSIGAYKIKHNKKEITFFDTPGHHSFTSMRSRGIQLTDIAILVVAADDGVKPQTLEAIDHIKDANVPYIVAINKIDKSTADIEKTKTDLSAHNIIDEAWGGTAIMVPLSAATGEGIDQLLDTILTLAELNEYKAPYDTEAWGISIESNFDKQKGFGVSLLVKEGILRVGDKILMNNFLIPIRFMEDDLGNRLKEAGPSTPVKIFGINEEIKPGDRFLVCNDNKLSKKIIEDRITFAKKYNSNNDTSSTPLSMESLLLFTQNQDKKRIKLIIIASTIGLIEAVKYELSTIKTDDVIVEIISTSVGQANASHVALAKASSAIILSFQSKSPADIKDKLKNNNIEYHEFNVIYKINDIIDAKLNNFKTQSHIDAQLGEALVQEVYKIDNVGTVCGCKVTNGKITDDCIIEVNRNGKIIYKNTISSLKRFKETVKEVSNGYECGIMIEKFNDVKRGDTLQAYKKEAEMN